MHVAVTTPAETIDSVRSYSSIVSSFARKRSGSASALSVSGLAQRSLTLQPTCSPSRLNGPLHRRLRQLCHLHRRFDCYRVERTSSRVGLSPTEKHRLSRRTRLRGLILRSARNPRSMSALDHYRQAHLFVPIALDWKAQAEPRIIDGSSQERGFPFGISWHVVAVCRRQLHLQRLVDACDIRVLDQPVAQQ
jgi:hypothetical protein